MHPKNIWMFKSPLTSVLKSVHLFSTGTTRPDEVVSDWHYWNDNSKSWIATEANDVSITCRKLMKNLTPL